MLVVLLLFLDDFMRGQIVRNLIVGLLERLGTTVLKGLDFGDVDIEPWRSVVDSVLRSGDGIFLEKFFKFVFLAVFGVAGKGGLDTDTVLRDCVVTKVIIRIVHLATVLFLVIGQVLFVLFLQTFHLGHGFGQLPGFFLAVNFKVLFVNVPRELRQFVDQLHADIERKNVIRLRLLHFLLVFVLTQFDVSRVGTGRGDCIDAQFLDFNADGKEGDCALEDLFRKGSEILNLIDEILQVAISRLIQNHFLPH